MIDLQRSKSTYLIADIHMVVFFGIGAGTCLLARNPVTFYSMLLFLGFLFFLLMVILYTSAKEKRDILYLLRHGRTAEASITTHTLLTNLEQQNAQDSYHCSFSALFDDGTIEAIEVKVPEVLEGEYAVGDTLRVRYAPSNPALCMAEPSEEQRQALLSKRPELFNIVIALSGVVGMVVTLSINIGNNVTQLEQALPFAGAWHQCWLQFFDSILSHPAGLRSLELFLILASGGVVCYSFYLLLVSLSRISRLHG